MCSGFLRPEGYWGVVQRALDDVVRWCCYREYCGIFEICMDMFANLCAECPGAYLNRLWLSGVNLSWGVISCCSWIGLGDRQTCPHGGGTLSQVVMWIALLA